MRTLYLECNMGASGDMLMGALYELLPDSGKDMFQKNMNSLFPKQLMVSAIPSEKCGIWGTKMNVVILGQEEHPDTSNSHSHLSQAAGESHSHGDAGQEHHHPHTSYQDVLGQIEQLPVSSSVREHAKAVYTLIGNAESIAHHTDISQIHFHEVGTLDALMDVVGCWIQSKSSPHPSMWEAAACAAPMASFLSPPRQLPKSLKTYPSMAEM